MSPGLLISKLGLTVIPSGVAWGPRGSERKRSYPRHECHEDLDKRMLEKWWKSWVCSNAFTTFVVRTRDNRGDGQKTGTFKWHVPSPDSNTCPCSPLSSLDQLVGRLRRVHAASSASLDTQSSRNTSYDDYFVSSMIPWCFIHNVLRHLFGGSCWPALCLSVLICKMGMRIVFIFGREKRSWDTRWKLSVYWAPESCGCYRHLLLASQATGKSGPQKHQVYSGRFGRT